MSNLTPKMEALMSSSLLAACLPFGEYLRGLRVACRLSLREAAPRVGISFTHLGRLECGKYKKLPKGLFLSRVSKAYNVPMNELVNAAGEDVPQEDHLSCEIATCFERLMTSTHCGISLSPTELARFPSSIHASILMLAERIERYTFLRARAFPSRAPTIREIVTAFDLYGEPNPDEQPRQEQA